MVVREGLPTKMGFLFAAAGAAVGLGALWRYPHLTTLDGSGYAILYAGAWLLAALPLLLAEFALGHGRPRNVVDAYANSAPWGWGWAGRLQVVGALLTLAIVAVVGGWVLRYAMAAFTAPYEDDPAGHFARIREGPDALLACLAFVAIAVALSSRGIRRGLLPVALVGVPLAVMLVMGLAVFANFSDGGDTSWQDYAAPHFGSLAPGDGASALATALVATGLGTGTMATLAAAHGDPLRLSRKGLTIAFYALFAVAVLGLFLAPLLTAEGLANGEGSGGDAGYGGMFATASAAFASIGGTTGGVLAGSFYLALLLLALAAAVALLEVPVSYLLDRYEDWGRWRAALLPGMLAFVAALPMVVNGDHLENMTVFLAEVLAPVVGLLLALRVAWIQPALLRNLSAGGRHLAPVLRPYLGVVVPLAMAFLLVLGMGDFLATTGTIERGSGGLWRLVP